MKIAIAQYACHADAPTNLATAERHIAEAGAAGAALVLLPELHNTPYFCQREDPARFAHAEPIPGASTARLGDAARAAGVVVVASLFERRAAGLYHNTAVVLDRDGSIAGRYRKMHIPDDPEYYEKYYFTPGDLGFTPIDTSIGRLGVLVCWDQWYPEAARLMALAGADLLVYPSAIGYDDATDDAAEQQRQLAAWQGVQRGHAIANGLSVITSNRVGTEGDAPTDIRFWGHSFVFGPQGETIAEAGADPELLLAEVDLHRTETVRRIWPFLRDRRIDAFGDITRRFRD
ncbi:carbon-nitrogen hydrolase [Salinisphaera sp. Q1T1-3]|uniref:carbon-nitrogen hydrolase n=1 Tax=Salinisphaera sp. Q1T1-3 TaxID=2321229 RepID=UPI000E718D27|nr:carbon-nitrogen hydrolase [Salinisphaera sp. Q1T1-3]RJS92036.1 acyltransferase [Salinisphaera sp. Q1T1-3]